MKKIIWAVLLIVLISGCGSLEKTGEVTKSPKIVREDGRIELYFCPQDECRERLVEFLKSAEQSIHCALFDVDLEEVKDELKRGIEVKLVVDVKNKDYSKELNPITNPGYQLMHNKFCVVDGKKFFTGSFNPTERGNFYNNNNMLIIESEHLAKNYEDEFEELFGETFAGGEEVKYPIVYLKDTKVENYFCPEDDCSGRVLDTLADARSEIYFMTFSFTDDDIGNMLIRNYDDDITVKGVFERSGMSNYSEYQRLKDAGMEVKLDNNKYKLHHKVFIIDNETVVTGSYNPTGSGDEKNDENVLIIHDASIAKKFLDEFERIWDYEETISTTCMPREDVVISELYYDCSGKDSEDEYVAIHNPTSGDVDLGYYFLSRGNSNQRLDGIISSGGTKKFRPKFSLPNSGGYVVLTKGGYQVDYVNWENEWTIEAGKGEILSRKSFEMVNCEKEWK
ncbi:MAG: lamin tail domain-containing protein [Candidatus Aenigmarchaeota archaeon]|nr:lamin tail domain-containing protein [Candidatus Aenigmarchaeota archaeon]